MFRINDVRRMKKRGYATTETKVIVDTSRMSTRMRNMMIRGVRDLIVVKAGWDTQQVMVALLKHAGADLPIIRASGGSYPWATVPGLPPAEQHVQESLLNTIATAARVANGRKFSKYAHGNGAWSMDVGGIPFADIVAEAWTKPLLTEERKAEIERVVKLLQDGIRVEYTTTAL